MDMEQNIAEAKAGVKKESRIDLLVRIRELEMHLANEEAEHAQTKADLHDVRELLAVEQKESELYIEQLKSQLAEQQSHTQKLEKELKDKTASNTWVEQAKKRAEDELELAHSAFDAIPGALPRTDESASYGKQSKSLMVRLVAYIATRSH